MIAAPAAVVPLRDPEMARAMVLERRYFSLLADLQEAYPKVCWAKLESVLASYGSLCLALGRQDGDA